jgi:hypothetical protein
VNLSSRSGLERVTPPVVSRGIMVHSRRKGFCLLTFPVLRYSGVSGVLEIPAGLVFTIQFANYLL